MIHSHELLKSTIALSLMLIFTACAKKDAGSSSELRHHHHDNPTSDYQDFYQLVAAGCDCSELTWLSQECANAPGGAFGGGNIPGYCGEAVSSCRYAVDMRNQQLGCWPSDQVPACKAT